MNGMHFRFWKPGVVPAGFLLISLLHPQANATEKTGSTPVSDRYSITVHERPSAILGNRIRIDCLNRTVFAATLPNSRSDLKGFAERAVDIAYQNASQAEIQRLMFHDADLGPDEL